MQICAYAYFVIVFWRVYGKLHSPFSCCFCSCCCFCYCCWHLRQQLQQQAAAERFSKNRIDRFEKIYKIKCGATLTTTTTTWRKPESIYGISAVPEGLTTRRVCVCVWGETPTATAASLRWFYHLPPFPSPPSRSLLARHSLSHCAPHM